MTWFDRRLRTLLALAAFTTLMAPAAAHAAANATARLTSPAAVYPTPSRTVAFHLQNTEPTTLGAGRTINQVKIILPTGAAGIANTSDPIVASGTWVGQRTTSGTLQAVTFTGGGLTPGSSQSLSFSVEVQAPLNTDRSGTYGVYVSSDLGQTYRKAEAPTGGTLDQRVRILEITDGPKVTAPSGATDGSATGGQELSIGYSVRNHAREAVEVTGTLESNQPPDKVSVPTAVFTAQPGAAAPVTHAVALGAAEADRSTTFTAAATATKASAPERTTTVRVQAPPTLGFTAIRPSQVASGATVEFALDGDKAGSPGLRIDTAKLSFASTTANLAAPVTLAADSVSGTLAFAATTVDGAEGRHGSTVTLTGVDGNGMPWSRSLRGPTVTIDNTAPAAETTMTLASGGSGWTKDAIRNGDTIGVKLLATDTGGLERVEVVLRPDVGADVPVAMTLTSSGGGQHEYQGTVRPTFDQAARSAVALATVVDRAGNVGNDASPPAIVDNVRPAFRDPAIIESPTQIRVEFTDTRETTIRGGCEPRNFSVAGHTVTEVRFSGASTSCARGTAPADGSGVRILVLSDPLAETERPSVSYAHRLMLPADNVTDGAGNYAASATVASKAELWAPTLLAASRNAGGEQAYADTYDDAGTPRPRWFTRFADGAAGPDLKVRFGGARDGLRVEVLDLDDGGRVIGSATLSHAAPDTDFEAEIPVPVGSADGTVNRALRFHDGEHAGKIAAFRVVLDRVRPMHAAAFDGTDTSTVTFSEPIGAGTDYANDWFARHVVDSGDATADGWELALSVEKVDVITRKITFHLADPSSYRSTEYLFTSANGRRYEDRAGNQMLDTI